MAVFGSTAMMALGHDSESRELKSHYYLDSGLIAEQRKTLKISYNLPNNITEYLAMKYPKCFILLLLLRLDFLFYKIGLSC